MALNATPLGCRLVRSRNTDHTDELSMGVTLPFAAGQSGRGNRARARVIGRSDGSAVTECFVTELRRRIRKLADLPVVRVVTIPARGRGGELLANVPGGR